MRNLWGLLVLLLCASAGQAQSVNVRTLLKEMADLDRLSALPSPRYVTRQASSYDPAAKGPNENWFANRDHGNFVRVERRTGRNEYVLADLQGPGAVVRIWTANPQGNLRIYVDGAEMPEIVTSFEDITSGKHPDFAPPFSGRRSMGANLYYPIPYSKSIKITVDDVNANPASLYYHVNYRIYESGTAVDSFKRADVKDAAILANSIANKLTSPRVERFVKDRVVADAAILQPGQVFTLRTPVGEGAVRQLSIWCKGFLPDENSPNGLGEQAPDDQVLRSVVFNADFDSMSAISSPVGDFFGAAPGFVPYSSFPVTIYESTGIMQSRWVMPQKQSGRFFLTNHSKYPIQVSMEVLWTPRPFTDETLYFRAKWKRDTISTRPMRDWNYLEAKGRGRYVGSAQFVANPVTQWWGEGDEKVYIDGEAFPSTFGTGTEDYFGYAWCCPDPFMHPYHNQPRCDGPGNRGYTAVNRWHIIDDLPWTTSFRFDMEIWHWAETRADFATIAYWYADGESTDNLMPVRESDLGVFEIPPAKKHPNAIEGEELAVLKRGSGEIGPQGLDDRWSNFAQVWWRHGKQGDRTAWEVPSAGAGRQRLIGRFCVASDYGIIQLYWNGEKLGPPIDFYNPTLELKTIDFGSVEVREKNTLEAEIVGKRDAAAPGMMFGIDYLLITDE
ncbi:MAG: DUF2961 domain-containing protein [Armatimonadetes bacterium]|nr:DUF2961 domain-containing protein [Armatimonadota bacterium]NOG92678.1 DUF2961 domain-containing protein [Armatimonadota bacterium]